MECGCLDPLPYSPLHRPVKDAFIVFIHPKNETRIDHNPKIMQAVNGFCIILV